MKATDLMVGDWVMCNGLKLRVASITDKVNIGFRDNVGEIYWAEDGLDRIDPIPLTEEILVKNGFEYAYNEVSKMQNKQLLVANIDGHYIEVRLDKKNIAIWYDCDENEIDFYSDVLLELPRNVHTLQHLLRLVGIKKEIEL